MMKIGVFLILSMVVGSSIAHLFLEDKGYVFIHFLSYSVEMSVPFFFILLLISYCLLRILFNFISIPKKMMLSLDISKNKKSKKNLNLGVKNIYEGNWAKGENLISSSLQSEDKSLIKYMLLAKAANSQGLIDRRDEWFRLAYINLPSAISAISLTKAELQFANKDYEGALATLEKFRNNNINHPLALGLLAKTYNSLGDWDSLIKLMPDISNAQMDKEERVIIVNRALKKFGDRKNIKLESLDRVFNSLASSIKSDPKIISTYSLLLARLGNSIRAEKNISQAMKKNWNNDLIYSYGLIRTVSIDKQLRKSELWLAKKPDNALILLTCARFCIYLELWGKAKKYLELSLDIDGNAEAYKIYGRMLKEMGDIEGSAIAYDKGLKTYLKNKTL
ncbi:MAG: hypothetical protein CBC38_02595 [Gammaproteobacteria bacterium TMED78]|mgnify:CR=1 FL=1|nr:MAG: hypothetical protein CBC38_02595 [Gammaproteobacteria bacterium TMED78]|tara:strand:+ start:112512 stop:113687 length:1176 start_codon:yes stop_codon:yes gene_type:complete